MAFAATTVWDVRTGGSDANGGGFDTAATGTDRSVQDATFIAFTDLVIGTPNTTITSVAHAFDSTSPGNVINVTGGTGFTTQRIQIVSVLAGVATCDKAVGTIGSTGGTGNLGGGLLTIGAANTLCVDSNTLQIQAGTYTHTAVTTIGVNNIAWVGYQVTHSDGGTKPLITTSTNSTVLINTGSADGGISQFTNLSLSNTASVRSSGIYQLSVQATTQWWIFTDCLFDGFTRGIDNSNTTPDDVKAVVILRCEVKNCTTHGYSGSNTSTGHGNLWVWGCYFHANAIDIIVGPNTNSAVVERSIFSLSTGASSVDISCGLCTLQNNSFYNTNSVVLFFPGSTSYCSVINNIFYGGATSISGANNHTIAASALASRNNAFGGGNAAANWNGSFGDITLSANPYTNAGSGDFSLNNTAGGGAACKGAGFQTA